MTSAPRVSNPGHQTGNVFRDSSLAHAGQTLEGIMHLTDSIWRRNSIRMAWLEMLRLRNARTVNCVFCKSVRYDVARQDGLTEDKVSRIEDGYAESDLGDEEKLVLEFADVFLVHPERFDAGLIARLRRHFTDEQICHMAISIGTFNAASKCAVSLGGMPESLPVMEIPVPSLAS